MKTYSFWQGFSKAGIQFVLFMAPFAWQMLPAAWMNLTVGAALSLLVNYLKVRYDSSAPVM